MEETRRSGDRPLMVTEIRAWLAVAVAFIAQLVAIIYWAANLTSDIKTLNQRMSDYQVLTARQYTAAEAEKEFAVVNRILADHETRLRRNEQLMFDIQSRRSQ
jgi:hypothetical protein